MNRVEIEQNYDSLDHASSQFGRQRSLTAQNSSNLNYRHDLLLKNIYRQQLDEMMRQKNEQKQRQKQNAQLERQQYNRRLKEGQQAQRLKDLSYKNYYQMLMNNQNNNTKNYSGFNRERDSLKEQYIQHGIRQQQYRSKQWEQRQQERIQRMKKQYQDELAREVHQKNARQANERQSRVKQQQEFNKITYTPQQIAQYERRRKLIEMNKYKQDLDKISPKIGEKSRIMTGSAIVNGKSSNDFNIYNQNSHSPMVNPLPYNIQNPYILRQFSKRQNGRNIARTDNIRE